MTAATTTETPTQIATAVAYLEAGGDCRPGAGGATYYEQGTQRWYRVTDEDLAELGRDLLAGEPDAYSFWCAATCAEELPEGWSPDDDSDGWTQAEPMPKGYRQPRQ